MMSSLALVSTIIVLGAPVAIVFIPWAIITGDATPLYNAAQMVVRTALRFARIRVETNGIDAVPADKAGRTCTIHPRRRHDIRRGLGRAK